MKKLKKLFAVMLSLIMVLAMGITSFADEAAPKATITVNGLDKNATVTYKQIIRPNTKTETGWEFVDENDITAFPKNATESYTTQDEQTVIWKLIKMVSGDATVTNMPAGTTAFSTSEYQAAVGRIATSDTTGVTYTTTDPKSANWSVSSAGVYVVNADSKKDGAATAYTYAPMAAYISFGSYNTETGVPSTLENATVTAKSTTVEITKEANETDKVVEVGKVVKYTATTKMPYVSENGKITSYKLVDTIDGAEYVKEAEGEHAGKVHVTGTVGTDSIDTYVDVVKNNENGKDTITVDLTSFLTNNAHANQTVVIEYYAKVTQLEVNNTIVPDDGQNTYRPAEDRLYTGTVTLTKTGEGDKKLADAKFVLKKTYKADAKVEYAIVTATDTNGVYKVTDWTANLNNAKEASNLMTTIANGTITVKGLDDTTDYVEYEFQEIEAPKGYSINKTNSSVAWATEGNGVEAANRTGTASMTDTKLSALPATGGIGTTIFTIVGCGIMIAAAGLFFASRRKENR
mgnify:CR=1 FL=1